VSRLETLVKLHRWQLNEKRRRIAELETLAATTQARIDDLAAELAAEASVIEASPETRPSLPAYLDAARERRRKLVETLETIAAELAEAREAMTSAFQELKKYEIALELREQREREVEERRQQIALDEMAIEGHRRRPAG
jgi:chromosome segregation ATPase